MNIFCRTTFLVSLIVLIGCKASSYRESLSSHLPRDNGSMLDVECVSYVKHKVRSVSPALQPQPHVTVIMDERRFVVHADKILVNDELYATFSNDVKKLRIEITEEGVEVTADGEPVTKSTE